MQIVYNGVATKCLQVFMCVKLLDGTQMLNSNPDTTCWEGEHIALVAASIFFLVVYVIGIPAGLLFVLLHYKRQNMLNDEMVMTRLGFLYARYEHNWYVCRAPLESRTSITSRDTSTRDGTHQTQVTLET